MQSAVYVFAQYDVNLNLLFQSWKYLSVPSEGFLAFQKHIVMYPEYDSL